MKPLASIMTKNLIKTGVIIEANSFSNNPTLNFIFGAITCLIENQKETHAGLSWSMGSHNG